MVLGQMCGIYQVSHLQLFSTLSAKFSEYYRRFSEFMPLNHNYLEFRNFVGEDFFENSSRNILFLAKFYYLCKEVCRSLPLLIRI